MVPTANHDPSDHQGGADGPRLGDRTAAVLDRLRGRTAPVPLSELAAEMADHGPTRVDIAPDAAPSIDHVQLRLHHVHLPALSDAGFLDYDEEGHLVSPNVDHRGKRPPLDVAFELLAHRHRREVLECLDGDRSVELAELAAAVAGRVHAAAPGGPPSAAVDRVRHALHHTHLPKLRQAGVVRYDPATELVTATADAHWLRSISRCADRSGTDVRPPSQ